MTYDQSKSHTDIKTLFLYWYGVCVCQNYNYSPVAVTGKRPAVNSSNKKSDQSACSDLNFL